MLAITDLCQSSINIRKFRVKFYKQLKKFEPKLPRRKLNYDAGMMNELKKDFVLKKLDILNERGIIIIGNRNDIKC